MLACVQRHGRHWIWAATTASLGSWREMPAARAGYGIYACIGTGHGTI